MIPCTSFITSVSNRSISFRWKLPSKGIFLLSWLATTTGGYNIGLKWEHNPAPRWVSSLWTASDGQRLKRRGGRGDVSRQESVSQAWDSTETGVQGDTAGLNTLTHNMLLLQTELDKNIEVSTLLSYHSFHSQSPASNSLWAKQLGNHNIPSSNLTSHIFVLKSYCQI